MDLSPRATEPAASPKRRNNRKWVSIGILVLVLAAGGVVLTKFLTNSLDYYCNVDEVVAHKSGCEANRRLRIQGVVDEGSLTSSKGVTTFTLSFNHVTVPVVYDGDPGGLFQECIPVVVHGELKNGVFEGDEVEVKHSNEYEEKNKSRIDQANKESAACLQQR